jgi:hypothetical protein
MKIERFWLCASTDLGQRALLIDFTSPATGPCEFMKEEVLGILVMNSSPSILGIAGDTRREVE